MNIKLGRIPRRARAAFAHVPPVDVERARIVVVPVLLPGIGGITLGRYILIRRDLVSARLLRHELVHVRQWREHGALGFLRAYLSEYLRARWAGSTHWAAYAAISFEVEARALAEDRGPR